MVFGSVQLYWRKSGPFCLRLSGSAKRYQEKETAKYEAYVQQRFGGFIESNPTAQKIDAMVKDPVKKEKALSELADKLNAKITDDEVKLIPFKLL